MTRTTRSITFAHSIAGLVWRAEHSWSMDAGAPMYFGFVVPNREMVALGREYNTDGTTLQVDLYQTTFTGGTPVETLNRRLKYRNNPPPLQLLHSVTPAGLTDRITGFKLSTQGAIRIGRLGEVEPFIHEELISYVLAISNNVAGVKDYAFSLDFRLLQPGEDQ
ncbi:hypothetical protein D9M68_159120 [compost metagenome]